MLRFENLQKRYGDEIVFDGLSRQFEAGCYALQAANGTGKSVLLGILAGTQPADAGEVWIAGHALHAEPLAARAALAWVPDDCMSHPSLSGRGLLEQSAALRNAAVGPETLDWVTRFGLAAHLDHRFEQMSLGMRKKMYLCAATLGTPAVILADEPSNGLDLRAMRVLVELFAQLSLTRVVLFSTHDPDFAQACAARTLAFSDLQN